MNNGDYFSDPDYDDLDFREQHPYMYGVQFHYQYLAWKARNKERIEQLNQPSGRKPRPRANQDQDIEQLIIVICILIFVVFMCICLGTCE